MARFVGQHHCTMDDRYRIKVPPVLRDLIAPNWEAKKAGKANSKTKEKKQSEFIITRGLEYSLIVYPLPIWEAFEQHTMDLDWTDDDNRYYLRVVYATATEEFLDRSGRLLLKSQHREWGRLDKEVKIIGGGQTHIEIFQPDIYESYLAGNFKYENEQDKRYADAAKKVHETIRKMKLDDRR